MRGSRWERRHALEQAPPEGDDPLGAILGPEDDRVAFADAGRVEPGAEGPGGSRHVRIGVAPAAEAVVVREEFAGRLPQIVKEVDQRLASHPLVYHTDHRRMALPNLPPALAVGALYDSFLQAALRQFFERATFGSEPILSASSDGRLAIEPTDDPSMMFIRWFGTRYGLSVPPRRPFTAHEIRLARSIGSVLAARYHAILNPKAMIERGELFRGAIEDRYVGAFADGKPYPMGAGETRADRVASAIEVLRVAALSSYENRPISSGVLILGSERDPVAPERPADEPGGSVLAVAHRREELLSPRRRACARCSSSAATAACSISSMSGSGRRSRSGMPCCRRRVRWRTRRTRGRRCSAGTSRWC